MPSKHAPSRAMLRALLGELFKSDQDFDAFLVDWFFPVKQRAAANMDRVAKTNLLFEQVKPDELWNVLELSYTTEISIYQPLLDRDSALSEPCSGRENLYNPPPFPRAILTSNKRVMFKAICAVSLFNILLLAISGIFLNNKVTLRSDVVPTEPSVSRVIFTEMIRIPSGQFTMGSDSGEPAERPPHMEYVKEFYLDRTEVTVEAYSTCVQAGICRVPDNVFWGNISESERKLWSQFCNWSKPDRKQHPINCVSWYQANMYCIWKKGRLPTEAEWEYAARGPFSRNYPWGDELPTFTRLNACGDECATKLNAIAHENWSAMYQGNDGWPTTAPAGSFIGDQSIFGILDLAGNVGEWVGDRYRECYASNCRINNLLRIVKGAAWASIDPFFPRAATRTARDPNRRQDRVGFRCAADIP